MITCQFEDGNKTSLRHVCVNAIVIKEGKILLGKRGTYRNGKPLLEAGKWALIGGFFDRDETLEEGLKREVMEESGWEIDDVVLFRINDNPNRPAEDRQNVDMIFVVGAKEQTGKSDEEVTNLEWF
jgi:8-oxo-dGTP diphosphatase